MSRRGSDEWAAVPFDVERSLRVGTGKAVAGRRVQKKVLGIAEREEVREMYLCCYWWCVTCREEEGEHEEEDVVLSQEQEQELAIPRHLSKAPARRTWMRALSPKSPKPLIVGGSTQASFQPPPSATFFLTSMTSAGSATLHRSSFFQPSFRSGSIRPLATTTGSVNPSSWKDRIFSKMAAAYSRFFSSLSSSEKGTLIPILPEIFAYSLETDFRTTSSDDTFTKVLRLMSYWVEGVERGTPRAPRVVGKKSSKQRKKTGVALPAVAVTPKGEVIAAVKIPCPPAADPDVLRNMRLLRSEFDSISGKYPRSAPSTAVPREEESLHHTASPKTPAPKPHPPWYEAGRRTAVDTMTRHASGFFSINSYSPLILRYMTDKRIPQETSPRPSEMKWVCG